MSSTPPRITTSRSPWTAHSASMPGAAGDAAYLVEEVLVRGWGAAPEDDGHAVAVGPAERAGPGGDGLVGLGAQHRVDDERLEPGVPGAAGLGGAGVDLGGGEGDLTGVAQDGGVDGRRVGRVDDLVDVRLDDLDAEPDQVDGLLERDDAGHAARGGTEDGGRRCRPGMRRRRPAGTSRRTPGCRPGGSARPTTGSRREARRTTAGR